jgi:hypothetical protein
LAILGGDSAWRSETAGDGSASATILPPPTSLIPRNRVEIPFRYFQDALRLLAKVSLCRVFLPAVLQHLLVGMNAHINFDPGLAAAATALTGRRVMPPGFVTSRILNVVRLYERGPVAHKLTLIGA